MTDTDTTGPQASAERLLAHVGRISDDLRQLADQAPRTPSLDDLAAWATHTGAELRRIARQVGTVGAEIRHRKAALDELRRHPGHLR